MKVNKKTNHAINLSLIVVAAPVLMELSKVLPPKYLWLAPLLFQAGQYLTSLAAQEGPTTKTITPRQMRCIYEIAAERGVSAEQIAVDEFEAELEEMSSRQASRLIARLKQLPRPRATPRLEAFTDAPPDDITQE